jgi:hypothetical protein
VKLNGATAHGTAAIAVDGITLPGQAELTLAR